MTTPEIDDETAITEITIQPDGRIYVFGLSLEVAAALAGLCPAGHPVGRLVATFAKQHAPEQLPPLAENAGGENDRGENQR
ncbi:MAG TPA: hypothetical protein VGG30_08180 [Pirellulales bacterium]